MKRARRQLKSEIERNRMYWRRRSLLSRLLLKRFYYEDQGPEAFAKYELLITKVRAKLNAYRRGQKRVYRIVKGKRPDDGGVTFRRVIE